MKLQHRGVPRSPASTCPASTRPASCDPAQPPLDASLQRGCQTTPSAGAAPLYSIRWPYTYRQQCPHTPDVRRACSPARPYGRHSIFPRSCTCAACKNNLQGHQHQSFPPTNRRRNQQSQCCDPCRTHSGSNSWTTNHNKPLYQPDPGTPMDPRTTSPWADSQNPKILG